MRKTLIAAAVVSAFTSSAALAQVSGNMTLTSDYKFRGITQTFNEPALQGGFDYAHSSGFYVGNWNSNISTTAGFPGGNLEMDVYGGYKMSIGGVGLDFGAIYYYYPGTALNAPTNMSKFDNTEIYVGASYGMFSAKYYYVMSDYFGIKGPNLADTDGSDYLDLSAAMDLGDGWGVNAHVGIFKLKTIPLADYTDYKIGVTKNVEGYVFGAAYIGTDANGGIDALGNTEFYQITNPGTLEARDLGKDSLVLSVTKSF